MGSHPRAHSGTWAPFLSHNHTSSLRSFLSARLSPRVPVSAAPGNQAIQVEHFTRTTGKMLCTFQSPHLAHACWKGPGAWHGSCRGPDGALWSTQQRSPGGTGSSEQILSTSLGSFLFVCLLCLLPHSVKNTVTRPKPVEQSE